MKPFEELQNITHLSLNFNGRKLNERILTNIDIYFPKLQYLSIKPLIFTDREGMTQMTEILSRLSSLKTIDLWLKYEYLRELMKAKIAEKCRKIRKIN